MDLTCMSYWFPKIRAAGLPVPETTMLSMPKEAMEDLWRAMDEQEPTGAAEPFFASVRSAADALGYPCFLRTGKTSGKHEWKRTCFLTSPDDVKAHVFNIAYFSECVDFSGALRYDVWAVRRYLPIRPIATCPNYEGMPVCREFRYFVNDGVVRCFHPYWPMLALERGGVADAERVFADLSREPGREPYDIAAKAGAVVGGSWSIDLLETSEGWFLTDMAEAAKSFHWEDCKNKS